MNSEVACGTPAQNCTLPNCPTHRPPFGKIETGQSLIYCRKCSSLIQAGQPRIQNSNGGWNHAGCVSPGTEYASDPKVREELAVYLKDHAASGRPFREIEQQFWRERTGKLLEEDLIAPGADKYFQYDGVVSRMSDEPELSLLVIDLGDSCVVKVEKGILPSAFAGNLLGVGDVSYVTGFVRSKEAPLVVCCGFEKVRTAIDALGDKPVPRIDQSKTDPDLVVLRDGRNAPFPIPKSHYHTLCTIAGHDLPIYEPKQAGTWHKLSKTYDERTEHDDVPVTVYRYTR
jgi:hypothetical protein